MADANTNVENSSGEARNSDGYSSKGRNSIRRSSVLININGGTNNSTSNNPSVKMRRESLSYPFGRTAYDRRLIRYENTYQMEPDDEHRVNLVRTRRIITSIIETAISGYRYDAYQAGEFAAALADRIRSQIKQLPFIRYKNITQVYIGQKKGQDLRVASRCLWNDKEDRHITITKENSDAYLTVTIFFIYYD